MFEHGSNKQFNAAAHEHVTRTCSATFTSSVSSLELITSVRQIGGDVTSCLQGFLGVSGAHLASPRLTGVSYFAFLIFRFRDLLRVSGVYLAFPWLTWRL